MLSFLETALGNLKDHRTIQQVFSDAASNKKGAGIIDIRVEDFDAGSVPALKNTPENVTKVMGEWASKNRNTEREKVMSLFTLKIDNADGIGQTEVFIEGSTGKGERYTGGGAMIDPRLSTSKFSNWKRSTTIHSHPFGLPCDFSSELGGAFSGGDLQMAVQYGVDLYLVSPSGNDMGVFNVNSYKSMVRSKLERSDQGAFYKRMSDAEMFKEGGVGDPVWNMSDAKINIGTVPIGKIK